MAKERYEFGGVTFTRGLGEERVWIEARHADEHSRVTLDVGALASCDTDGVAGHWPLWNGLPVGGYNRHDPLLRLTFWVRSHMPVYGRDCKLAMREVYALCRDTAIHAAGRCEPKLRRSALRFGGHARWFVYRAMRRDPTGRVAQLFDDLPGIASMAVALRENGRAAACDALLSAVVAGLPRRQVLDVALDAWWDHARDPLVEPELDRPWRRLREASPAQRAQILAHQRWLVRRAPACAPTTLVWLPPPVSFRHDDLPTPVRQRRLWFRMTKSARTLLGPDPDVAPEHQRALSAFVSRNAVLLAGAARQRSTTPGAFVRHLAEHCQLRQQWPEDGASAAKFLDLFDAYRNTIEALQVCQRLRSQRGSSQVGLHTRLPTPQWVRSANIPGVQVEPITTVRQLIEQGRRLQNCLAVMGNKALDEAAYLFTVQVGEQALALEIDPQRPDTIVQLKRKRNNPATSTERRLVRRWLHEATRAAPRSPDRAPEGV